MYKNLHERSHRRGVAGLMAGNHVIVVVSIQSQQVRGFGRVDPDIVPIFEVLNNNSIATVEIGKA